MTDTSGLGDLLGSSPDLSALTSDTSALLAGPDTGSLLGGLPAETPDPLAGVEYTGDLATDSALELTALEEGYRARAAQEEARFRDATDSEFWVAVCFPNREAKEAFLAAFQLAHLGDKYLDGQQVAHALRQQIDQ